ncbi:MAG: cytochrome P460 family protein [Sulfitobacter sp.]
MKFVWSAAAGVALALVGGLTSAHAEEACTFEISIDDFEDADVDRLYKCISDDLAEGYAAQDNEVGSVYRDWQVTATRAAAPGAHSNRMLLTFANETAYEPYVQYTSDESFVMPVGSVLAKESFSLTKKGKPRRGPLFVMTKVAAGEADEFGNWVYAAVQPKGKVMKIKQSFCHDCHVAFSDQDSLGYPDTDVRFEN